MSADLIPYAAFGRLRLARVGASDSVMTRALYEDEYFAIDEDDNGDRYVRSGDEVLVLPVLDDGRVAFIVEPSPAFGDYTLILPGGQVERGEPHAVTANRELQEEAGYRATQIEPLGELRPFSKYLRLRSFVFLARGLVPDRVQGDERHHIEVVPISLEAALQAARAGSLRDARVLAALLLAGPSLAGPTVDRP